MTDTTQQPASEPDSKKRWNVLELLTNARGLLQAGAALTTALLAFVGGQAVTEDKAEAALSGQVQGQEQAARAVEAALERALPKALAPVTAQIGQVQTQVQNLHLRVWAVERGVVLPADVTEATELPRIELRRQRQHRLRVR